MLMELSDIKDACLDACLDAHQATEAIRQKIVRVIQCRRQLDDALNDLFDRLDVDINNVGKAVENVKLSLLQAQDEKITDELDVCISDVVTYRAKFFELINQYGAIDVMPQDKKTEALEAVKAAELAQKRHDELLAVRKTMWRCL